jgi:hypothetical protein
MSRIPSQHCIVPYNNSVIIHVVSISPLSFFFFFFSFFFLMFLDGIDKNVYNQTCFALVSGMVPTTTTTSVEPAAATAVNMAEVHKTKSLVVRQSAEATATNEKEVMREQFRKNLQASLLERADQLIADKTSAATTISTSDQESSTKTAATTVGASQPPDLFHDYYCNYYNESLTTPNATLAQLNYEVFVKSCYLLSSIGCCTGTLFQMYQQNQVGLLTSKTFDILPPCWLNYLQFYCPTTSLSTMCYKGSFATQTTIVANFTITKTVDLLFPNMYNQSSILLTQGILTGVLGKLGLAGAPYNFVLTNPFQVMIVGYTYYSCK